MAQSRVQTHRERHSQYRQPHTSSERYLVAPSARLALAIIQQAVEDWNGLIRRKAWRLHGRVPWDSPAMAGCESSFAEIRLFFEHGFIELLLPDGSTLTPEGMLATLERRLKRAMEEDTEWMQAEAAAETAPTSE